PDDAEVVSFDNPGDLFVALEAADIVAILQDLVVNGGRLTEDTTVSVVETYPTNELYGFAFKNQGDEMLAAAVNEALSAVRRAGTYDQIWSNWFGK
ncbi:MAG TPA: transporter substrate-binding domain-containing protein, partial [Acidimicrobiia bacterium]|nr:transporter substrate-binding domain-containing protein [Acidimicrobiia bacterium]